MKNKNKFKPVNIKVFIIPFIIVTLIFFMIGHITINSIQSYYYNHMKENSLKIAHNYSENLSKANEAYDVVNELLKEKLLVASETTVLYTGRHSNELLKELANTLKVDEIYSYNPQGEVVYSNTGKFIGWKPNEGHPVANFMISDRISLVEDIRQDTETGIPYKYGYFRASDGRFVQIGVRADKINHFLAHFEMQHLLDEMKDDGVVAQISFIDNGFKVIGSTENRLIGQEITDQTVKTAIRESREYGSINNHYGEEEYEVFVPVYLGNSKLGTLAIGQSLIETEVVIRKVSIFGILVLLIVYATLLFAIIFTHKKNRKLIQLAYYDTLTGLPNDLYLKELIAEEIEKRQDDSKALLLINCCNFRLVNLTNGYEFGDELLREISREIQKLVVGNDKLFRFSVDRFMLYVSNYQEKKDLVSMTTIISELFDRPFKVNDAEQNQSVQIGIVEINRKYHKVDQLLKDASISLSHIKSSDSLNYAFFNEVMENKLQREDLIEKELRIVLKNDCKTFYLEFQPQVDLKTNKVICFEALARMRTESLGFISPVEFIDVAERKQLIIPLGNLILKTVCEFIRTLESEGYGDIKVAVNISGIQLLRDDFTDTVMNIIKETDIEASRLELEITESVLLDNYELINEKLETLRDYNIGIALDDFGTGYSSFSRLSELNIDTVKIDRYFINHISIKEHNELIIGDIISMAHKLGLAVVAEGVEDEVQKDYLIENECDIIQGYLFSKPISSEKAVELLKANISKK